ncbi:MAG: hypothetical protein K0S08_2075 [Gammaproteobacteria bacterium]|nr:hypothetical protein [Gammaproteobacteria bacterium]
MPITIYDLPDDVVCKIFAHCDKPEKSAFSQASKRFNEIRKAIYEPQRIAKSPQLKALQKIPLQTQVKELESKISRVDHAVSQAQSAQSRLVRLENTIALFAFASVLNLREDDTSVFALFDSIEMTTRAYRIAVKWFQGQSLFTQLTNAARQPLNEKLDNMKENLVQLEEAKEAIAQEKVLNELVYKH